MSACGGIMEQSGGLIFFYGGGMDGAGARSLEYIRVLLAWWRAFGPACPGWVDESYRTSGETTPSP